MHHLSFIHYSPCRAYQELSELLEIASLLGRGSPGDKNGVRLLVAETALEEEDYWYCCHLCTELMTYQYTECWQLCKRLALCEHFKSIDDRRKLVSPPQPLSLLCTYSNTHPHSLSLDRICFTTCT